MKRVVSLMHRQAVRQKAEGLYFMVSTLYLFKQIMAEERILPCEQPYKNLIALINYILRKFFKVVEEDSFFIIEVRSFFDTLLHSVARVSNILMRTCALG